MRSGSSIACVAAIAVAVLAAGWCVPAAAQTPAEVCKSVGTDDTTHPVPEALAPAVNTAFKMRMPAKMVADTTVFRCVGGHVMACTTGANLPCGQANASRTPNAGMVQWCHDKPDENFIPAYMTGHDTIYQWDCHGGSPRVVRQTWHVDPRGFVAEFWKPLP